MTDTKQLTTGRLEHNSFGEIEVETSCLWGAQTQRSLKHFNISSELMPEALIQALAQIKLAAATEVIGG